MNLSPNDKKRLQTFMSDMLKIGCLQGLRYIDMYMRGREELVINIPNEPNRDPSIVSPPLSPLDSNSTFSPGSSYGSGSLAAQLAQMESFPPASPNEDTMKEDPNKTMFLLACYTRYNRPLVWARTNQERLKLILGSSKIDQDNPLALKSTTLWKDKEVKIWEILAELVRVNTRPHPSNPFAIDWDYLETLSLQERILLSASLINFLQRVIQHQPGDRSYSAKVLEDIAKLNKKHFEGLHALIHQGGLPILEKQSKPQAVVRNLGSRTQRYPSGNNKYQY
ncbi:uncharacterized protein LOC135494878 [Lineus longissimus]|uniref:uncharacterized protein LOC135494878 n=1 Tax=Lineus longissimus TaxID=88925 RepID=UPI002B4C6BC8